MNIEIFIKLINEYSNKLDIKLNEKQIEQFFKYMNLLLDWNEKINLTAITDPNEIILKHFIDSITILKNIPNNTQLIDVGTGAGFPGIPINIVNNSINVMLLDSLNKRINFLNEIIKELKLENINTIHARVEEFGRNKLNREKYDIATSRAVASLNILVEYMLPLVKVGGKCICMKGSNIQEELKDSKNAINILGGEIEKIETFNLPNSDISRNIVIIKKVKETPTKYPRKPGTPSKEPIK